MSRAISVPLSRRRSARWIYFGLAGAVALAAAACQPDSSQQQRYILAQLNQEYEYDKATPLMAAAAHGAVDSPANTLAPYFRHSLHELILAGVDLDAQTTEFKMTALMFAAYFGQQRFVDALVSAGAKGGVTDAKGRRAVDYASEGGHKEVAKWFIARGLSPRVDADASLDLSAVNALRGVGPAQSTSSLPPDWQIEDALKERMPAILGECNAARFANQYRRFPKAKILERFEDGSVSSSAAGSRLDHSSLTFRTQPESHFTLVIVLSEEQHARPGEVYLRGGAVYDSTFIVCATDWPERRNATTLRHLVRAPSIRYSSSLYTEHRVALGEWVNRWPTVE